MNTPGASMPPAASPGTADHYIIGTNTRPANPTPLSAPQEQQVRDLYYKNVRAKCAEEIEGVSAFPFLFLRLLAILLQFLAISLPFLAIPSRFNVQM
ncbi:hypothetical protein SVAN01_06873, partial [Stagonosporopsis vannaccii]